MSRKAEIFLNNEFAGMLEKTKNSYIFRYEDKYFQNPDKKPISLTLSKKYQIHQSEVLFPFFFNLLPEGTNKKIFCREFKIDENDYFSLLLKTAHSETIGAVTIKEIPENQ